MKDQQILELRFSDGGILRCAAEQVLFCPDDSLVVACELRAGDQVVRSARYVPRADAAPVLPDSAVNAARGSTMDLPEMWDEEFAYYLRWLVGDGSFSERGAVTIYGSERDGGTVAPPSDVAGRMGWLRAQAQHPGQLHPSAEERS